ncbi:MAG: hypothetical protein C0623_01060 [Desulfuromonas sp.]|nr:MAG: hypothetical protein C0623_01060 [Desulfuromonas sp.]
MKCGMCHKQIPDATPGRENRCGACSGGCRLVHCPYCGYGNPLTPGFLKILVKDDSDEGRE